MKFSNKTVTSGVNILANDHFIAIPYDCSELGSLATNGIIPAGTIIPANDATAKGVLLNDVNLNENPNGSIVIHGFIRMNKLPSAPTTSAISALKQVTFIDKNGAINPTFTMTYDKNGGSGSLVDASSPYPFGATVTVKAVTGFTAPDTKTFDKWNTKADGTGKAYSPSDTFTITENTKLYAIWK